MGGMAKFVALVFCGTLPAASGYVLRGLAAPHRSKAREYGGLAREQGRNTIACRPQKPVATELIGRRQASLILGVLFPFGAAAVSEDDYQEAVRTRQGEHARCEGHGEGPCNMLLMCDWHFRSNRTQPKRRFSWSGNR